MLQFEVLTLFPDIFSSFLQESLIHRAIQQELLGVCLYNFRQHGLGKHKKVDDLPYGGGPGMVLRVEPVYHAIQARSKYYHQQEREVHKVLLTPQGQPFNQQKARELIRNPKVLMLICGRYEGFDERIRSQVDEEISGGDFICLGGEVIAMMIIETLSRLIPGVLGNQDSSREESFARGLLEYPQYTRPASFMGKDVPEVLLSGNHQLIRQWRNDQALERTAQRRPNLLT